MWRSVVVVLLALAGVARAGDDQPLDTGLIADHDLDTKTALGCEATRSRTGGFLAYSNLEQQCTAVGVKAPRRDLLPKEKMIAEASCAMTWRGQACSSLAWACERAHGDAAFPRLAAVCLLAAPAPPKRDPGTTEMWFGLELGDVDDGAQLGGAESTFDARVAMHGLVGLHRFAPAVTTELALGTTGDGGFRYHFSVGFGAGMRLGADGQLALTVGGGLSGITGGRLGNAWLVPVEATALIPIGATLRVALGARGSFVFREDDRQDGVAGVPLYDEVDAHLGLAFHRSDGALFGLYGFASHLRETSIVGLALAVGRVEVITP